MKTIKLLVSVILLTAIAAAVSAQSGSKQAQGLKSETFKVWGNCESCKTRIEAAVKSEGAANASWDQKTMMLKVSFDPQKTNVDALQKKLATVGHDTEKYKAPTDVYDKLPSCCKYERSK
jgi:periplasmic mercuric ion binding protein